MSGPIKISGGGLPSATALGGTEVVAGVQGNSGTYGGTVEILISQIGTYVRALFTTTPATIAEGGTAAATAVAACASLGAANLVTEDQTLVGGVIVTSKNLGTISSGTVTPDPGDRPQQYYINGGAHTLAPSSNGGSILLDITNNASAGAITTSGFTKVSAGAFTTTNGDKFRCHISVGNAGSLLQIQAMQ